MVSQTHPAISDIPLISHLGSCFALSPFSPFPPDWMFQPPIHSLVAFLGLLLSVYDRKPCRATSWRLGIHIARAFLSLQLPRASLGYKKTFHPSVLGPDLVASCMLVQSSSCILTFRSRMYCAHIASSGWTCMLRCGSFDLAFKFQLDPLLSPTLSRPK